MSTSAPTQASPALTGFERLLDGVLSRAVRLGSMDVQYPSGATARYGNGGEPHVGIGLKDVGAVRSIYMDPGLKFAEMYMDGRMSVDAGGLDEFVSLAKMNGAKRFATPPATVITLVAGSQPVVAAVCGA